MEQSVVGWLQAINAWQQMWGSKKANEQSKWNHTYQQSVTVGHISSGGKGEMEELLTGEGRARIKQGEGKDSDQEHGGCLNTEH